MAWSLLGVILVEILLFAESIIVFLWRLLVRLIKWMHIKDNTKVLIDETQNVMLSVSVKKLKDVSRKDVVRKNLKNVNIFVKQNVKRNS